MSKTDDIISNDNSLKLIEKAKGKLINDKDDFKSNIIINLPKDYSLDNKEYNKQFLNKKRLFKVIYREYRDNNYLKKNYKKKDTHNELSSDNITTTIIRHFTNFVFGFINQSIKEGLPLKDEYSEKLKFNNINNENKILIKVKDIKKKSIKDLLLLKIENSKIYENVMEKIDYSYNNLFKRNVLELFYDIYNKNEKKINLERYDVKGVEIFNLDNEIETIEKLKEKIINKNGIKKVEKLESIINRRFLKFFKVKKN